MVRSDEQEGPSRPGAASTHAVDRKFGRGPGRARRTASSACAQSSPQSDPSLDSRDPTRSQVEETARGPCLVSERYSCRRACRGSPQRLPRAFGPPSHCHGIRATANLRSRSRADRQTGRHQRAKPCSCDTSRRKLGLRPRCSTAPLHAVGAAPSGASAEDCSARSAFRQNALQRAPVHVETSGRLGNVATAEFVDALDMLPPHTIGRHRVFRHLGLVVPQGH